MRPRTGQDRGAVLIISALAMVGLMLIVAIVIDLGYTRSDRRAGQVAVDNAAASAAPTLADQGAAAACETALDYLRLTLESPSFTGEDCSKFLGVCDSSTVERTVERSAGIYAVVLYHPVLDMSPLMARTSTINAAPIGADPAKDGTPCERFGVRLSTVDGSFFGGIAGEQERSSRVHAVSRVKRDTALRRLNLLVLDRKGCQTFSLSGLGNVIVAASADPTNPPNLLPGIAGVDSDGTDCTNKTTLEAKSQAVLRADGPCVANAALSCPGRGDIQVVAPFFGDGSCSTINDRPACEDNPPQALITPNVTKINAPSTRAPVDHRFNCKTKAQYDLETWAQAAGLNQKIDGCANQSATTDYIDELKAYAAGLDPAALPVGWNLVGGGQCNSNADETFPAGNTFVNCGDFKVGAKKIFPSGNVVFADKVTVSTGGTLTTNECAAPAVASCPADASFSWSAGNDYQEHESSRDASWIYANGLISISGGSVNLHKAAAYLTPSSTLKMTGGAVTWIAPSGGPFSDLALWSASTADHDFTGNGAMDLRGTFFVGEGTLKYSGTGAPQVFDNAQFIANKMDFSGQGTVSMKPAPGGVEFLGAPSASLIR